MTTGTRRILKPTFAALLASAAAFCIVTVAPPAAQAAGTCPDQNFCYFDQENLEGFRGTQLAYTGGYIEMPWLVDLSESSLEHQTKDTNCFNVGAGDGGFRPVVRLRDNNSTTTWTTLVAERYGQQLNTFNNLTTGEHGVVDMRNRFNRIWNKC